MAGQGGRAVRDKNDPEYYREIGKRGGEVLLERRGPGYFAEMGRKGGKASGAVKGRRKPPGSRPDDAPAGA